MKVGIDARLFGPKWGGGGLGRYVEELVNELQRIDSKHRVVLFLKPENAEACQIVNPRFEKVIVDAHWYTAKEQFLMPRAIKKAQVDLMHFPHWNVAAWSKVPFVVTIHDLILLDDPTSARATTLSPIRYLAKRMGYHHVLHQAIGKSKKIIAVSKATKQSIEHHFHTPSEKIQVIYEGVSCLTPAVTVASVELEIPPPYFLYVGSAYPHKNLKTLLQAFSLLIQKYPEVKLVLVGKKDLFYQALGQEMEKIGIPKDRVVFTGFVPDADLAAWYQNTALYVFPSRFEGFGLPPLEAMWHGAPVASSKRGPLPEVLGQAAVYFDPDDVGQIAAIMEEALNNQALCSDLKQKGQEQVKKYSWSKMAEETLKLYEQVG